MANYIELYRGYDPKYNNYGSPHTFIWASDDIDIAQMYCEDFETPRSILTFQVDESKLKIAYEGILWRECQYANGYDESYMPDPIDFSEADAKWFRDRGYNCFIHGTDDEQWIILDLSLIEHPRTEPYKQQIAEGYVLCNKCTDYDDGNDVQRITHWDEWSNGEYYGVPTNDSRISIIDTDEFLELIGSEPRPKNIEYCAKNNELDIIWAYDSNGVHWFYSNN